MSAITKNFGIFKGDAKITAGQYGDCTCGRYTGESFLFRLSSSLCRSLAGEFRLYW